MYFIANVRKIKIPPFIPVYIVHCIVHCTKKGVHLSCTMFHSNVHVVNENTREDVQGRKMRLATSH